MIQNDFEFSKVALAYYDNPSCVSAREFQDDIKRFNLLNRALSNTETWNSGLYRKLINSVLILYNIFGDATNKMLRFKSLSCHIPKIIALSIYLNKYNDEIGKIEDVDVEFLENLICH